MEKSFYSPQGREIMIVIQDGYISFYHGDAIKRQQEWYNEQLEMGCDVSEQDSKVSEFYYISQKEWISDKSTTRQGREDNWHFHMKEKTWFTQQMMDFINKN